MRKNAILASLVVLVVAIGAYLVWQGRADTEGSITPTPNPTFTPAPAPVPTPNPSSATTSQDYKAPFKTFSGRGITVSYPSAWTVVTFDNSRPKQVVSILSPSTKQSVDAGMGAGYGFDLNVQQASDIFTLLGNSYEKQENVSVGGKSGYRVIVQGNDVNDAVLIEHNGYYLLSFPPRMDRKLEDEILKNITFTK